MRTSNLVPQSAGKLVLPSISAHQLGFERNAVLHGIIVSDRTKDADSNDVVDCSIVLSTIPVRMWEQCYKLNFTTAARRGSLARACEVFRREHLELLSIRAIGASLHGDLHATAVVTEAKPHRGTLVDQERYYYSRLQTDDSLSSSELFAKSLPRVQLSKPRNRVVDDGRDAKLVRLSQLRFLRRFSKMRLGGSPEFQFHVTNSVLDLADTSMSSAAAYELLLAQLRSRGEPPAALVASDSEERYIRVWLVPELPLHVFRCGYRCSATVRRSDATQSHFAGIFQEIVARVASEPLNLNIYHADQSVIAKTQRDVDRDKCALTEQVQLKLVGETRLSQAGTNTTGLLDSFSGAIRDVSQQLAKRGITLEIPDPSQVQCRSLYHTRIPVFVATNLKKSMGKKPREWLESIVSELCDLELTPVNVDMSLGGVLIDEVIELIGICPLLVSIHFPEEEFRLAPPKRKRKVDHPRYCPSPWVMFEESMAISRERCNVFRLRHDFVVPPRPFQGRVEISFKEDQESMRSASRSLIRRISKLKKQPKWEKLVHDNSSRAISDVQLFQYDLALWLRRLMTS